MAASKITVLCILSPKVVNLERLFSAAMRIRTTRLDEALNDPSYSPNKLRERKSIRCSLSDTKRRGNCLY